MTKLSFLKKIKKYFWRLFFLLFSLLFFLVIYLDSLVKDEFKQQAWSIPAKVFARPLSFSEGKKLSLKDLKDELGLLGYRQVIKATSQGEYEIYLDGQTQDSQGQTTLVINTRRFNFWDGVQPEQILEVTIKNNVIIKLKDFSSQKMVNFLRLDPLPLGVIQAGGNSESAEDRQLVTLDDLPEYFIATLLNTEDRDFYHHWGFSLKGIARALWSNISQGGLKQGGSTLTQQLMKNHFLSNERSLWRKFREAIMAILTEIHYDKNTILEAYINEVYLGQDNNISINGFARASEFYFDRPLAKLNLNQVATLIGMVKGPSVYNPRRNAEQAKNRRNIVLGQMKDNGLITDDEFSEALSLTLQVVDKPKSHTSNVPGFMGYIKRELRQEYSLSEINNKGLRLFTSLDPLIQKKAEVSLSQRLNQFESNRTEANKNLQGAIIVSDVQSGDILAMVGDRDPNYLGFNRAIDAYRQTGSVIKPFVYLTALQQTNRFNLLSQLSDEPFSLKGSDGSLWTPSNYDNSSHGKIELKEGLINSYNLATAKLAIDIGLDKVVSSIHNMGFERELPAFPSIALGAKEMSPLEILKMYQVLANDGEAINSTGLIAVQDHQGHLLQRYKREAKNPIDEESAFLIKYLLTEVVKRGTAKTIGHIFGNKLYAGKTGTTNDLKDSWYVGFGEEKLAVVWLGRDDNLPMQLTGASGALKVWQDLYLQLNESSVKLNLPQGLVWGYKKGGFFSGFSDCKNKELIPFYPEQVPQNYAVCE